MAESARVTSIEALRRFRPAMIKFAEQSAAAIMTANAGADKTLDWLKSDRAPHWKRQIRRRQELLTRAKSELFRKQNGPDGNPRPSVDEKKAVERAQRALREAQEKLAATMKWIGRLQKDVEEYRSGVQPLGSYLRAEVPKGIAALEEMARALDDYVAVKAPSSSSPKVVETDTSEPEAPEPSP